MISSTHTVVDPWAMVVIASYASFAVCAVFGPMRLFHYTIGTNKVARIFLIKFL